MSFLNKLKQAVGVGTVRVELNVPGQIGKGASEVEGEIVLTAAGAQKIKRVTVKLIEEYTSGHGEDKETKRYELGKVEERAPFELAAGETKSIKFVLPFRMEMFSQRAIGQRDDIVGAMSKVLAWANSDKVEHEIVATVDVEGAAFDATDRKPVRFV